MSPFVLSDTMTSLSIDGGYSSNLFNDSFAISDSYTTLSSDLLTYPSEMLELNAFGDLKLYSQTSGLSNFLGGVSVTFIPTSALMKSQLYFNSSVSMLRYGTDFSSYNNAIISGSGSWSYQLSQKLLSTLGGGAKSVNYTNTTSVTDKMYYFFGGLNATLLTNNSFYFEAAFYQKDFTTDDSFNSANSYLDLFMRFSRPIGNSVGLNISYLNRNLETEDEAYMPGFTIDYLSPWSTLWGGDEISISLKKIFRNQFIMTLGASYSEKAYIDQLESDLGEIPVFTIFSRSDKSNVYSIHIEKSFNSERSIIAPRLSVSFIENSSDIDLYDYDKILFNGSINISF